MTIALESIRACFEGAIPSALATTDAAGEPNVVEVSQVEYVDDRHLALSFQFFNKTRRNILQNPHVQLMVAHPGTGAYYRITARYLRTESTGALFERMKAKLAGVASHTGMAGVFQLRGSDVYEVAQVEQATPAFLDGTPGTANRLPALRRACDRIAAGADTEALFDAVMQAMRDGFGLSNAMLLMLDRAIGRLYTVASCGYSASGAGAEIALGEGVIGVAAQALTPIRINYFTQDSAYMHAVRGGLANAGLQREIPYPGLPAPNSQLAIPIEGEGELLGVLFTESERPMAFDGDLEDALAVLCARLGSRLRWLQQRAEAATDDPAAAPQQPAAPVAPSGQPLRVRCFEADGSVFMDDDYVIKGVAGAILRYLLNEHEAGGRREFTNRELRLAPQLRLPDVNDNLETRLILLRRRLADRGSDVQLLPCGRGRFRLELQRPLQLAVVPR